MKFFVLALLLVAGCARARLPPPSGEPHAPPDAADDKIGSPHEPRDLSAVVDLARDAQMSLPDLLAPDQLMERDLANGTNAPDLSSDCIAPTGSTCKVAPQCGCQAGQNCDIPDETDNARCVAGGATASWSACHGVGECAIGTTCLRGVCTPFCVEQSRPASDCEAQECYAGNGAPNTHKNVCSRACNPLQPTDDNGFSPCGPGVGCIPTESGYARCIGATASGGLGAGCRDAAGKPDQTLCAPGYFCLTNGGGPLCRRLCRSDGDCPNTFGTCRLIVPEVRAGGRSFGYCSG